MEIEALADNHRALLTELVDPRKAGEKKAAKKTLMELSMHVLGSICEPRHKPTPFNGTPFDDVDKIFKFVAKLRLPQKTPYAYVRSADGKSLVRMRVESFNERHQPVACNGMVYFCVNISLPDLEHRVKDTSCDFDRFTKNHIELQPHYVSALSLSLNRECHMLMFDSLIDVATHNADSKKLSKNAVNSLDLEHHVLFQQSGFGPAA